MKDLPWGEGMLWQLWNYSEIIPLLLIVSIITTGRETLWYEI